MQSSQTISNSVAEPAPGRNFDMPPKYQAQTGALVVAAMFVAWLMATCAHMPFMYDGSQFFLVMINDGEPRLFFGRWGLALIHWPTIWIAHLTGQIAPAEAFYCGMFSLGPLLSVAWSWLLVRSSKPALFIWPLLAIGLTSVYAQIFRVGENLMVCELAWPLLLGVLVPLTPLRAVCLMALAVLLVSLHPVALSFLGAIAVVAFTRAFLRRKEDDAKILVGVACFLLLTIAVKVAFTNLAPTCYEVRELGSSRITELLQFLLLQWPTLIASALSILAGFTLLLSARFKSKVLVGLSFLLIGVSGAYAVFWSSKFLLSTITFAYLRFLFLLFAPLMTFAILDSFVSTKLTVSRALLCVACAWFFMFAATSQYSVLNRWNNTVKKDLAESKSTVLDMNNYRWGHITPFCHWGMPSYSVLLQGRNPKKIILPPKRAAEARTTGVVRLTKWPTTFVNGWFHLPDTREVVPVSAPPSSQP